MKISKGHWQKKPDGSREDIYWWYCPGCDNPHLFDGRWTFVNNDYDKPTFTASYLARSGKLPDGSYKHICHSFVTDGAIQFLADCTHALAGQTVPMPELPEWLQ